MDNRYVVDTSLFASIGAVNPSLTPKASGCADRPVRSAVPHPPAAIALETRGCQS